MNAFAKRANEIWAAIRQAKIDHERRCDAISATLVDSCGLRSTVAYRESLALCRATEARLYVEYRDVEQRRTNASFALWARCRRRDLAACNAPRWYVGSATATGLGLDNLGVRLADDLDGVPTVDCVFIIADSIQHATEKLRAWGRAVERKDDRAAQEIVSGPPPINATHPAQLALVAKLTVQ